MNNDMIYGSPQWWARLWSLFDGFALAFSDLLHKIARAMREAGHYTCS